MLIHFDLVFRSTVSDSTTKYDFLSVFFLLPVVAHHRAARQ